MLMIERHDDVTRLHFSSWRSRRAGYSVSCYVVRGVAIDAAFADAGDELDASIGAHRISGFVITHGHDDHAGNAERLAAAAMPMLIAPDTEAFLRKAQPGRVLARKWAWGPMPLLKSRVIPFKPEQLELIDAPGHSPDHRVVWDPTTDTVFASDLFLGVKVRVSHPPERENVRQQIGSIRRVVDLRPRRVFDAHRGLLKDGVGMLAAKANWIEETCGRIDALIDAGWDDRAIAHEVLGREPLMRYLTAGDWSHRNFVSSVRATHSTRAAG